MSKPEPPHKIDPLPTPRGAEPRKTGWEPPSPQKVRSSERKMGVLLACCLLAAIGFVAYRKFDEQRYKPDNAQNFLADKDSPPGESQEPVPGTGAGPGEPPPVPLATHDAQPKASVPTPVKRSSAPDAMLFGDFPPPVQSEPEPTSPDSQSDAAVTFDPPADESDFSAGPAAAGDPLLQQDADAPVTNDLPEQAEIIADTSNPFGGAAFADSAPPPTDADDAGNWSSDADSPFGATAELGTPEFDSTPVAAQPKLSPDNTPGDSDAVAEMPVLDLFGVDEPIPVQPDEPDVQPPLAASPWGEPVDLPVVAETEPPQLLEPNDPQVMPTLSVNPFATADAEPEPPPPDPTDAATFSPFPEASAVTEVRESRAVDAPAESANPFAGGGSTSVTQREPVAHHDPFAPAHDVSRAVNEDEVVIHVVRAGENFWKIAGAHYGAGKYASALAAYNQSRIPDPRRMRPGMKVLIPSQAALAQQFPQLVSGGAPTPYVAPPTGPAGLSIDVSGQPQYRVAKGDTLSGIAQQHLGRSSRWRQIYGMNRDQLPDAHSLTTGMILRLPVDAAQVRVDVGNVGGR